MCVSVSREMIFLSGCVYTRYAAILKRGRPAGQEQERRRETRDGREKGELKGRAEIESGRKAERNGGVGMARGGKKIHQKDERRGLGRQILIRSRSGGVGEWLGRLVER